MGGAAVNIPARRGSKQDEDTMLSSPASLHQRCVAGDAGAWRELHRQYGPTIISSLRHLGVPPGELEDAAQDVFVQVIRYLARFERRADFKTWLYKLCISQAARLRRRWKLAAAWRWLWPGDREPAATRDWTEAEVAQRLRGALDRMKAIHRTVFVLYELEGLSGREVAAATGLPFATVRRRLHNARREFEAIIEEQAADS
jgi:RNA polymerase sigma-70 factor, ECF subfamily